MAGDHGSPKRGRQSLFWNRMRNLERRSALQGTQMQFSNLAKPDDAYRGEHPEFAEGALVQFSVEDTI